MNKRIVNLIFLGLGSIMILLAGKVSPFWCEQDRLLSWFFLTIGILFFIMPYRSLMNKEEKGR